MRPKVSIKTVTNSDLETKDLELDNCKIAKNVTSNRQYIRNDSPAQKITANFPNNTRNTRYCEKTKDQARSTIRKNSTDSFYDGSTETGTNLCI